MSKNKLKKFAENKTFNNLIQPERKNILNHGFIFRGKWCSNYFFNNNPLVIELGCGKGEYTIGLANQFSKKNFIGIDIKGSRIWRGAKTAIEKSLKNVAFVRTQIQNLDLLFSNDEINEIWITFPDPHIKFRKRNKRLISQNMLELYKKVSNKDCIVNLKTDSEFLHGYTLGLIESFGYELIETSHNIDLQNKINAMLRIRTEYEKKFRKDNIPITYIKFKLK